MKNERQKYFCVKKVASWEDYVFLCSSWGIYRNPFIITSTTRIFQFSLIFFFRSPFQEYLNIFIKSKKLWQGWRRITIFRRIPTLLFHEIPERSSFFSLIKLNMKEKLVESSRNSQRLSHQKLKSCFLWKIIFLVSRLARKVFRYFVRIQFYFHDKIYSPFRKFFVREKSLIENSICGGKSLWQWQLTILSTLRLSFNLYEMDLFDDDNDDKTKTTTLFCHFNAQFSSTGKFKQHNKLSIIRELFKFSFRRPNKAI